MEMSALPRTVRRKGSRTRENNKGGRGHPCPVPLRMMKWSESVPSTFIQALRSQYRANTQPRTHSPKPIFPKTSHRPNLPYQRPFRHSLIVLHRAHNLAHVGSSEEHSGTRQYCLWPHGPTQSPFGLRGLWSIISPTLWILPQFWQDLYMGQQCFRGQGICGIDGIKVATEMRSQNGFFICIVTCSRAIAQGKTSLAALDYWVLQILKNLGG